MDPTSIDGFFEVRGNTDDIVDQREKVPSRMMRVGWRLSLRVSGVIRVNATRKIKIFDGPIQHLHLRVFLDARESPKLRTHDNSKLTCCLEIDHTSAFAGPLPNPSRLCGWPSEYPSQNWKRRKEL